MASIVVDYAQTAYTSYKDNSIALNGGLAVREYRGIQEEGKLATVAKVGAVVAGIQTPVVQVISASNPMLGAAVSVAGQAIRAATDLLVHLGQDGNSFQNLTMKDKVMLIAKPAILISATVASAASAYFNSGMEPTKEYNFSNQSDYTLMQPEA